MIGENGCVKADFQVAVNWEKVNAHKIMVYKISILRSYEQPEEALDNCTPFIHLYKLCRQATQTLSVNVQKNPTSQT